jgi:hypothetical protein
VRVQVGPVVLLAQRVDATSRPRTVCETGAGEDVVFTQNQAKVPSSHSRAGCSQERPAKWGPSSGEFDGSCPGERAGGLGEDRQVGMEPSPIQPTKPGAVTGRFLLGASEPTLYGGAAQFSAAQQGVARGMSGCGCVDQPERVDSLLLAGGADVPPDGTVGGGAAERASRRTSPCQSLLAAVTLG